MLKASCVDSRSCSRRCRLSSALHMPSRASVFDVVGLGLLQELGHIRRRDGVAAQARFESLEPECCQHQQPRNERNEQPGHKVK